jgi:hypothetical protein
MNDLKLRRGRRTRSRAIEQMIHEKGAEIRAAEIALHGLHIELEDIERTRHETDGHLYVRAQLRRKNRNDSTKLRQAHNRACQGRIRQTRMKKS